MKVLCIDPGTEVSGVVSFDPEGMKVSNIHPAIYNEDLIDKLWDWREDNPYLAIEMFASYGMPVGRESFETVLWTGRIMEAFGWNRAYKVYRKDVKLTLCHSPKANDASIRQALLDLFPRDGGGSTPQVGTKSKPGPLYGMSKHAWAALGVGIAFTLGEHYQDLMVIDRI